MRFDINLRHMSGSVISWAALQHRMAFAIQNSHQGSPKWKQDLFLGFWVRLLTFTKYFFKLRLGALIPRSVCLSVRPSVCPTKLHKHYKSLQDIEDDLKN